MSVTPTSDSTEPSSPSRAAPAGTAFGRATAALGHVRRAGRWAVPPRFRALAWMGGVDLDLTDAVLPPEGAVLELLAVLGVITIRVPAGLLVILDGDAVTWSDEAQGAPLLPVPGPGEHAAVRIVGRAVLGKVHVNFVSPPRGNGEASSPAHLRR